MAQVLRQCNGEYGWRVSFVGSQQSYQGVEVIGARLWRRVDDEPSSPDLEMGVRRCVPAIRADLGYL